MKNLLIGLLIILELHQNPATARPSPLARRVLLPVLAATLQWSSFPALGEAPPPSDLRGVPRFMAARTELQKLDADWDQIVAKRGGGDGVRRVLGTVYAPPKCEAALCGWNLFIDKFVRSPEATIDLSEFDTPSLTLQQALVNADFLAYSSGFADYGNGGGGQELLEQSHKQVQVALLALDELIGVVSP